MTSLNRMKELVNILQEASKAYYAQDREIISNLEYDRLYMNDGNSFTLEGLINLDFGSIENASLWQTADDHEYKLVYDDNFNNIDVGDTVPMNAYLTGAYKGMFDLVGRNDGLYLIGRNAGPIDPGSGVPEPSTWALLILGAAGLLYMRKK